MQAAERPHLIIIGGGFGGLTLARGLKRAAIDITLIDKANHHVFQPLLYQVATAALSPGNIALPLRSIFRNQKNVRVLMNRVDAVVVAEKKIRLVSGDEFTYDRLDIATGARHSYFGHNEWEKNAPGLKTLADALKIRQKILVAFERAEALLSVGKADADDLRRLLTFVVVGAGPTGVELAGSIAEIAHYTLRKEFRGINPDTARIVIVDAAPHVLTAFPSVLGDRAARALEKLKVEVHTQTAVTNITQAGVQIGDEFVPTANIFWAAGNTASSMLKSLGSELDRAGRALVGDDLALANFPEVSVIGDAAHAIDSATGQTLPGVAPVAIQQGQYLARKIKQELRGKTSPKFRYWDKGSMATIGRGRAVAKFGNLHFSGFVAWLMWSFIHILYLIGFRNRFAVMSLWIYSYLTNSRTVRLITADDL